MVQKAERKRKQRRKRKKHRPTSAARGAKFRAAQRSNRHVTRIKHSSGWVIDYTGRTPEEAKMRTVVYRPEGAATLPPWPSS